MKLLLGKASQVLPAPTVADLVNHEKHLAFHKVNPKRAGGQKFMGLTPQAKAAAQLIEDAIYLGKCDAIISTAIGNGSSMETLLSQEPLSLRVAKFEDTKPKKPEDEAELSTPALIAETGYSASKFMALSGKDKDKIKEEMANVTRDVEEHITLLDGRSTPYKYVPQPRGQCMFTTSQSVAELVGLACLFGKVMMMMMMMMIMMMMMMMMMMMTTYHHYYYVSPHQQQQQQQHQHQQHSH